MSSGSWRVACNCGYAAEGLGERQAMHLVDQYNGDGHSPYISAELVDNDDPPWEQEEGGVDA